MKLPAYPRYKPSGVEWLSDVPEHWEVKQLSKVIVGIKDGTHGSFERVSSSFPLLSAKNVTNAGLVIGDNESSVSKEDHRSIVACGYPRKGDLLITIVGTIGRSFVFEDETPIAFQRSVAFLRFSRVNLPRYFAYQVQSKFFQEQLEIRTKSAAQGGVYMGELVQCPVFAPPYPEQAAIASFLDTQAERIDLLVARKRQLVERLKEKRMVLISRTVTRGLPPTAVHAVGLGEDPALKRSGLDWLGDIPKHWDVVSYKRVCTRVDVGIAEAATHAYCDDGVPIIRSTNVKPNRLDTSDVLRIEPWFAEKNRTKTLRAGDLVTVRTGYPGTTAIVPMEFDGCQCFTLVASSPKSTTHGPYFSWLMNSKPGASYFEMEGWGTAQTNISVPIVQFMPVPRPPFPEQVAIAAYLDVETSKLDALVSKVEEAIERLQEYRTALITAAVTGKIDVRKAVA